MSRRPDHEWMLSAALSTEDVPLKAVKADEGVIEGVAVVTEGEARGHGVFLDQEFVDDVITQGNARRTGLKVRFGHPNMSSTALGTFLGRAKHFRREVVRGKALARADLYLSQAAAETPQGDLRAYVLSLAKEDAKAFGMSIVFERKGYYRRTPKGKKVRPGDDDWKEAPPKDFVELKALHASDMVDTPAANPNGLFSASPWSRDTWAGQVTEFLDLHPDVFRLVEEHPEVVEQFMARYRAYLQKKGKPMPDETPDEVDELEQTPETPTDEAAAADAAPPEAEPDTPADAEEADKATDEAPAEEPEPAAAASAAPTSEAIMAAAKPYIERFGAELGPKWFAEGKTLAEATDAYIAHLSAEVESRDKALAERDGQVADLTAKLDAARKQLGDEPVGTGDPPSTEPELDGRAAELKAKGEELLEKGQITAAEAALMGVFNREG